MRDGVGALVFVAEMHDHRVAETSIDRTLTTRPNVQAFIRRAPRMADKTSWTKPLARMTYGDSIVAAGGLEAGT
jgi:hypothetical protein